MRKAGNPTNILGCLLSSFHTVNLVYADNLCETEKRTLATTPSKPTKQTPAKAPARPALTDEQKAHQRTLAKVKRLNLKLSKIKAISVNMGSIANRTNEVSSRQVEDWSKKINAVLNGDS